MAPQALCNFLVSPSNPKIATERNPADPTLHPRMQPSVYLALIDFFVIVSLLKSWHEIQCFRQGLDRHLDYSHHLTGSSVFIAIIGNELE